MLNQQNAIVKVLTGGFSPQRERDGSFPSHAICATAHIKSTWNFMLLGLCVLCGWSARGCVCAGVLFSLSHTRMQKYACTKTHTYGVFHLRCEARPPSAFLTCNHVQICTGRQGEGESHVNLCGCFLFFVFYFFLSDYRRSPTPEIQITFCSLSNAELENIFLSVLFQPKEKFGSGTGGKRYICQVTST